MLDLVRTGTVIAAVHQPGWFASTARDQAEAAFATSSVFFQGGEGVLQQLRRSNLFVCLFVLSRSGKQLR